MKILQIVLLSGDEKSDLQISAKKKNYFKDIV